MLIPIDETVHFDVTTHEPATGAISDADSAPTFDVFEEATDTPILDDQTMTKRTSLTGDYRGTFTASAANGFEAGKWYSVVVSATVDAVAAKHVAMHFRVAPAESSAGVPKADVSHWLGTAAATPTVGGVPEVDVTHWLGTAAATPTVAGVPEVDVTHFGGSAGTFASGRPEANASHIGGSAISQSGGFANVNVEKWNTTDVPAEHTAGYPIVTVKDGTGTGEINTDAGKIVEVSTLTGHTPQTGDTFARLGAPAGASVSADIAAIEAQTDDIGAAGAGLTAIPWNAAWDAEVQSEVDDALVVHRLDELLNADSDIDGAAPPTVGSVFHELMTKTTGSFTYDQTTDALEAVRDRGDAAWTTATGFSTHSAADVWAVGTRTLTSFGTLVADVATAVWAAGTRTLTAFDSSFKTGYALSAAGVQAIWDALTSALTTAGSIGKLLVDNINATISSRASQTSVDDLPTNAELATALDAIPTASENATGLLDLAAGVETGLTFRQAMRLIAAAEAGKLSGAATATIVIRNAVADDKNRITATVDVDGNRSAITVDLT